MKTIKIITLLAFASLLMSAGCSTDTEDEILCDCKEVRYTLRPGDNTYQWHSTIDMPELNCDSENLTIHYNGFYHVKTECN